MTDHASDNFLVRAHRAPLSWLGRAPLRAVAICVVGAIVVVVVVVAVRHRHRRAVIDPVIAAAKVSSAGFGHLSEKTQVRYEHALAHARPQLLAALNAGRIQESQYAASLREAWIGRMERRARQYAALTDVAARRRYLDRLIDQHQRGVAQHRPPQPNGNALLRERVANWSPRHREELLQFFRAVEDRRRQRGLPADPQYVLAQ